MKKRTIRLLAGLLCVLTLAFSAVSCSSGKALLTLDGQKIPVNLYELYLSRQKGTLCTTYYYGAKAKFDDFWETTISTDGTTYNDYWTAYILQCAKIYLAALYMFDEEYKLELPESYIAEIDKKMQDFVEGDGEGSKSAFNAILADYGVNYNMLKESYIIDAKIDYLQKYLYGNNLSKVSDDLKEQYYQENYVRFKQVFFAKYYYVYEKDADGEVIYYDKQASGSEKGKILYDKTAGTRKFDADGKVIKDKFGEVVYYREDGKIAYDSKNGVPSYTYDDKGNYKTELYSKEEQKKRLSSAEDIAEFTNPGDTDTFESYIEKYSEDSDGQVNYPNGYYFSVNAQYAYDYIVDIITQLGEMKTGEIRVVESEYGYHVIMKYEPDKGAYADKANDVWFESENVSFTSDVRQWLFEKKCGQYLDRIEVNEKMLTTVDMKMVNPNYYY